MSTERGDHLLSERALLASGNRILANCAAFFRGLRRMGIPVSAEQEALALEALACLPPGDETAIREGWRAILAHNPTERQWFDIAWRQFVLMLIGVREPLVATQTLLASVARLRASWRNPPQVIWLGAGRDDSEPSQSEAQVPLVVRGGRSAEEALRDRDAARLTPEELRQLERVDLAPLWRSSRRERTGRKGRHWDPSATLRSAARYGECLELKRRRRMVRRRRSVWVCDISGSMEPYSRMVLRFVHAVARAGNPVELFVCSTRLTRLTPALALRDADRALAEMIGGAPDWSGGTRLAAGLRRLRLEWGRRLLPGSVLILVTDGLEAEDPEALGVEVRRLRGLASRTIWLNPARSDPDYEPTARGGVRLAGAVDHHWPGYSWRNFEEAWDRLGDLEKPSAAGGKRDAGSRRYL
ncbi:MAG: VWA domain-containing protein [Kyrpidia tusciae]|nr:VWA domain-containing protein [Kyrpidia tusciae]MBE3551941.1 VWA domain-containing protein [Kyrpidia tusciae]